MTGYIPQQLLAALGKARRQAWQARKTMHVVVNDGLTAWLTGPLKVVDRIEPRHTVVIRDVHPAPMTGEMCDAVCRAICHDPSRAGHIADALREIMQTPAGEPLDLDAVAAMLWDMTGMIGEADRRSRYGAST